MKSFAKKHRRSRFHRGRHEGAEVSCSESREQITGAAQEQNAEQPVRKAAWTGESKKCLTTTPALTGDSREGMLG
jgi:hypothetical protein